MIISSITIAREPSSIEPMLSFEVTYSYEHGLQLPIAVFMRVFTEDTKLIGIAQPRTLGTNNLPLNARDIGVRRNGDERRQSATLLLPLSARQLDHIEAVRARHRKRDVVLKCDIEISYLESTALISGTVPLEKSVQTDNPMPLGYAPPTKPFGSAIVNLWLLSGDGSAQFMKRELVQHAQHVSIGSGDWVHDYLTQWNSTRYIVLELPQPAPVANTDEQARRIGAAIEAAKRASEDINNGEWGDAVLALRPVWELFRKGDDLQQLLLADGYSSEAAKLLLSSVSYQFQFASKFIHALDQRQEGLNPVLRPAREDAFLCYSFAMSLVNLFAQKSNRLLQRGS